MATAKKKTPAKKAASSTAKQAAPKEQAADAPTSEASPEAAPTVEEKSEPTSGEVTPPSTPDPAPEPTPEVDPDATLVERLTESVSIRATVSFPYPEDVEPEVFQSGGANTRNYRVSHISAQRTLGGRDDSRTRYSGRAVLVKKDGSESTMRGTSLSYGYVPKSDEIRAAVDAALDAALARAAGK